MAKQTNILIIGAFDRYNYGDLLFPLVIEEQLKSYGQPFNASFYGMVKSDLSALGGKPTEDIQKFYRDCDGKTGYTCVIVAGGEAVAVTWTSLLLSLNKLFKSTHRFHHKLNKLLDINSFSKKILHGKTALPFVFDKTDFKNVNRVVFNSLGGSEMDTTLFERYPTLHEKLRNVDYFAVRDKVTQLNLAEKHIETLLYPDSAILMSKFFTGDVLAENVSSKVSQYATEKKKAYIFFQIKNNHAKNKERQIAQQLDLIAQKSGFHVCLCPIGKALNHDDHIALQRIAPLLKHPFSIFNDVSIWDIMYLIANAGMYTGTSLHGAITAMSFAVPYVGVAVPKLDSYLQTWGVKGLNHVVAIDDIAEGVWQAMKTDQAALNQSREKQLMAAEESFARIRKLVLPE